MEEERFFNAPDVVVESANGEKAYLTLIAYEKGSGYPCLFDAFESFSKNHTRELSMVSDETTYYALESGKEIGPNERQDWVRIVNTRKYMDDEGSSYVFIDDATEAGASGVVESILIGLVSSTVFEVGKRFLDSLPADFQVSEDDEAVEDAVRKHLLFVEKARSPVAIRIKKNQVLVGFEAIDNSGITYRGSYIYRNGGRFIQVHHKSK